MQMKKDKKANKEKGRIEEGREKMMQTGIVIKFRRQICIAEYHIGRIFRYTYIHVAIAPAKIIGFCGDTNYINHAE